MGVRDGGGPRGATRHAALARRVVGATSLMRTERERARIWYAGAPATSAEQEGPAGVSAILI
jgi:hypothetical protein